MPQPGHYHMCAVCRGVQQCPHNSSKHSGRSKCPQIVSGRWECPSCQDEPVAEGSGEASA